MQVSCGSNLLKRLFWIVFSVVAASVILGYCLHFVFLGVRDVSIKEIAADPESFDSVHVRLQGYVVKTSYLFGPKYVLRDFGDEVEIALGGKERARVDLKPYVSFIFDGRNYTQIAKTEIQIVGSVRYVGSVTDFPSVLLEVENAEPVIDIHL